MTNKPFKTVMVEYFENFHPTAPETPAGQVPAERWIRVVTTTHTYNSGSSRGEPIVHTTSDHL